MKQKLVLFFVALFATTALWAQNNVITYTASAKLTETTSQWSSGLHTNAFNVSITSHTFSNGTGTITFSGDVKSIGNRSFDKCGGLTSITIPNSVTSIGECAFRYCSGLTSITIPDSVTSIGYAAFYKCNKLTSITIPNSVTSIGECAFRYCSGLTSVTIPNSVTIIGHDTFSGCNNLTSITIPDSVTSIGISAFSSCSGLKSVTIGNRVTSIGYAAFYNCSGLTSVTMGNSVTNIENYAFENCSGLTSITIPNSVTSIGDYAFNNVLNIVYSGTATGSPWGAKSVNGYIDGWLVYESAAKTKLLGCSSAATGEITIPNSVTNIGNYAFDGCSGLTSITIPNSVTRIGISAFYGCSGLTSITIGNSVKSIGEEAFGGCSGLTSITIPNSVTSIGYAAFYNCNKLTSITIPNSVTSIGECAFRYCSGLTSVTIPNSVTNIRNYAFDGCSGLTSITIPNSVTSIGNLAFYGCSNLTSVTLPNTVTIVSNAFFNCSKLTTINVKVSPFGEDIISNNIKNAFSSSAKYYTSLLYSVETLSLTPTCAILRINLSNVNTSQYAKMSLDYDEQAYLLNDNITTITVIGLQPNTENRLRFFSQLPNSTEWRDGLELIVTTPALELTTLAPKVTSTGEAIVCATTNLSENESNAGFEWRKYNAPSEMPSMSAFAFIYNGSLQGKIKNLASEYYKVRAFYEATDGTRYYGDWKTFDPTEFSYFDPEVHTYFLTESPNSKRVAVRGYVMAGTNDISKQGFEYWEKDTQSPKRMPSSSAEQGNNNVKVVYATGQIMSVVLEDLDYEKTYYCRAFATTSEGTIYGEQIEFTTPIDPRPQYTITLLTNGNGSLDGDSVIIGREGDQIVISAVPNEGYQFSNWSDGNTDNPRSIELTDDMTLEAIFVEITEGIDNISSPQSEALKLIENGHLYILRGGKKYTMQGAEVK